MIALAIYILLAFPLYAMAQKTSSENPWFAFVPILNLVLMCEIAGKELWWFVLFLIPCVNFFAIIIVWMAIAEKMEKPSWYGALMIVPGLNFIMPYVIAFG